MAQAFNLTAQLNLRGPSNVRQIVSDIKKEIGTINGNIKFTIDPTAINNTTKLSKSLQELNTNLANVTSTASSAAAAIKNFGQSVSSIGNSSSKLSSSLNKTVQGVDKLGTVTTKSAKNIAIARTEMEEFGRQSALAIRRFAAFSAVTGIFFSLNRAVNSGIKSFIDFDKELVKLQQITGKSAEGLRGLQDEIIRLSTGLGVSSDSLIQVSSTLAQAGLSATETKASLEALARSSLAPSFDDINQTVEGSIALMRQFSISAKDLEKALGSVNAVAAAFAVEASDIIAAIQRTGGVFANASKGVSEGTDALNEFIAVFTSVRATTRESAETIATGLRTIFTRVQRAGTIEALKEFGVNLTDVEGKFVGAYKAVQLLSEGLGRIDPRDIRFSQIVEELGGFRQIGKVIPLIQQFATAQDALRVAQAGQGSLASDAAKAQLSLANQISKVREEFLSLIRDIGSGDTFQTLSRGALSLASGLIKITGALKGVLPALTILGAGAGLRGITQFTGGFIGGLKKVQGKSGPESVSSSIGRNVASTLVGAKTEQVSRDLDQNSSALDKVSGRLDTLTTSVNSLDTNINAINALLNNNNALLQQSISSLANNTSSLDRLTDAINNFKPGGGSTLSKGGPVLGFSSGGTVPGSGRGDKIPAMLEPGEVVMSNRAVNRYGRGNLVRMNKYAKGGPTSLEELSSIKGGRSIKSYFDKTVQAPDEVFADIQRINISKEDIANFYKTNKDPNSRFRKDINKTSSLYLSRTSSIKGAAGLAFEDFIVGYLQKQGVNYSKTSNVFEDDTFPLDLIGEGLPPAEVRFRSLRTDDNTILAKKLRYDLISSKKPPFTSKIDKDDKAIDLGPVRLYEIDPDYKTSLGLKTGGYVSQFVKGGAAGRGKTSTRPQRQIFDSSPTPMLQAILARTEGKKPTARQVQLRDYAEEITDTLNTSYDDNQIRDGVVSMMDQHSDVQRYIDVSIKALKADLAYINKGAKISSDNDIKPLKARKGISTGDMLDTIMAYQSIGLDSVLNTALAEGRTNETLEEFMGDSVTKPYKGTPRGKLKISQLVKNMEASAQYKMPPVLYSGLGDSKLDIILKQAKITPKNTIDDLVGKMFTMPSFLSASSAEGVAGSFARAGQLTILTNPKRKGIVPQNAKSLTLDETELSDRSRRLIGQGEKGFAGLSVDRGYAMAYDQEGEYIFPPNSKFRITEIEKFNSRLFPGEGDDNYRNVEMKVQQLKKGGVAKRAIGVLDYDEIAENKLYASTVARGMQQTGITGPRLYADHLTKLATQSKKRIRAAYGVSGVGKSRLSVGQGTDNARLRQTTRFPILTPEDIDSATEIMVLSSTVSKSKIDDIYTKSAKTYTLSSLTQKEQDQVQANRVSRETTRAGLQDRPAGATLKLPTSSAVGEGLLTSALGKRHVSLALDAQGRLRRKRGAELVDVEERNIDLIQGSFSPLTGDVPLDSDGKPQWSKAFGHMTLMGASKSSKSSNIPLFLVGPDEPIDIDKYMAGDQHSARNLLFPQELRVALAKAVLERYGAVVVPKARDFAVPQAFDVTQEGNTRPKVLVAGKQSRALFAEKTEQDAAKYADAGYKPTSLTRSSSPSDGVPVSGTRIRDMIMSGDLSGLQQVLAGPAYDIISTNVARLQNRGRAIPAIISQSKQERDTALRDIEAQIKAIGISRIDKKKMDDPEYAAKVQVLEELRKQRDKIKSRAAFEPYRLLDQLAKSQPDKYGLDFSLPTGSDIKPVRTVTGAGAQKASIGGLIQKFMAGGAAEEPDKMTEEIAATKGRAEILRLLRERPNGLIDTARAVGVGVSDIREIMGVQNPDAKTQGLQEAIRREYVKTYNRQAGATRANITKTASRGLVFGAAGMFGNKFADKTLTITSPLLKSPRQVTVTSGVMDPTIAAEIESMFSTGFGDTVNKAATKARELSGDTSTVPLSKPIFDMNALSSVEGYMMQRLVEQLGGPAALKGQGFDFPNGLKSVAKYFGIDPDIPTDVKRTLAGPSTITDNIVTYLKNVRGYASGGMIQKFAKAGKVQFGTGTTAFPRRISNAYEREAQDALLKKKTAEIFGIGSQYPLDERMMVDLDKTKEAFDAPFDEKQFLSTFSSKIKRDSIYQHIADFARLIGLPREDISLAVPEILDFTPNYSNLGKFDRTGMGVKRIEGYDLASAGFTEGHKQDEYGYKKLLEEKRKEVVKITKTPVRTFDDGSFAHDYDAANRVHNEIASIRTNIGNVSQIKSKAEEQIIQGIQNKAKQTGRGAIVLKTGALGGDTSTLYHELTHQLFQGLRTRSAESFQKYKDRVSELFSTDNNQLSEAFDQLQSTYSSADVVYGRSYKVSNLDQIITSKKKKTPVPGPDLQNDLGLWAKSMGAKKASEFKPLNPLINKTLLDNGLEQAYIDRIEDSGKEEFLTTLVQNANKLDESLKSVLDSTLTDLLASAGVKKQKFAGGGTVPALVSNGEAYVPPKVAKKIGYGTLNRMNQADRNGMGRFANGGISVFKGPGSGTSDSIRANLPVGSYILREKATKALGLRSGGGVGIQKFAFGGSADDRLLVESRAKAKGISFDAEVAMMKKALIDSAKDLMNPTERQNTLRIMALENKSRLELINKKRDADLRAITEEMSAANDRINAERKAAEAAAGGDATKIAEAKKKAKEDREELKAQTRQKVLDVEDDSKTSKDAIENTLMEQIKSIDPSLASDELRKLSAEIMTGFDAGNSLNDIISSSKELESVFNGNIDAVKAQQIVVDRLTEQFGLTKTAVESLASASDVKLSDTFDKNSAAAARMSAKLAKASLVIGAFSNTAANAIRAFGGSENRGSAISAAGVEGFGTTVSTLAATLSQIQPAAEGVLSVMGKMGGSLGSLSTSLGPQIMGLLTNPITAAVAAVVVATVGLAAAFKESWNAAREFDKQLANKRVETSLERLGIMFDEFGKDMSKTSILTDINDELNQAIGNAFTSINIDANIPKMFWANMFDAATGGADAAQRSTILEKQGFGAYLESTSLFGSGRKGQENNMFEIAPQLASQQAQTFKPMADNIFRLFEQRLRTGSSVDELMNELKDASGAPTQFANAIARANPIIQEQIIKTQARADLTDAEKTAMVNNIIAREAEKQAILNTKASLREIEFEKLDKAVSKFITSLERIYSNMEMSINRAAFEIQKLSDSAELANSSLSGSAKAGETRLSSINILQNRRAYGIEDQNRAVDMASSFFGSIAPGISSILNIGDKLETSILSTINRTRTAEPGATDERVFAKIQSNLNSVLTNLQIPENLVPKFSEQIKNALKEIKTKGDLDTVNFEQIAEEVPGLTKQIESARRAQEVAVKALEFYQSQLNEYANAMNSMVELQFEANKDFARAADIIKNGNNELSKVFGREISLREQVNTVIGRTGRQTGGATDPTDITRNILNLENARQILQSASNSAGNQGPGGKDEFQLMQNRLRNTNLALRENYDALKNLADSSDIASAAMNRIQEIQQRIQTGANLIEKVVTSSPEELVKLNSAMGRLNNNMMGIVNNGTTSEQRGESLQAFNQIAPLLGDGAKQNELKANVLESMLIESGQGITPMFAQVLDSLRNPENDPQMQEAIGVYKQGLAIQSAANMRLGDIKQLMIDNTADIAAQKLKEAITGTQLSFESQTLNDINKNIIDLKDFVKNRGPAAAGLARGGVVYASAGQAIDFAPKGTDTVPAMLTPGEFVVNRKATQANLPLLQNINSGKYSTGGKVNYLASGGVVPGPDWSSDATINRLSSNDTEFTTKKSYPAIKKTPDDGDFDTMYSIPAFSYAQFKSADPVDMNNKNVVFDMFNALPGNYPDSAYVDGRSGSTTSFVYKASKQYDRFIVLDSLKTLRHPDSFLGSETTILKKDIDDYILRYNSILKELSNPANIKFNKEDYVSKAPDRLLKTSIRKIGDRSFSIDGLSSMSDNKKYLLLKDSNNMDIKDGLYPTIKNRSLQFKKTQDALSGGMGVSFQDSLIKDIPDADTLYTHLESYINELKNNPVLIESIGSKTNKISKSSLNDFWHKKLFSINLDKNILDDDAVKNMSIPLTAYNIDISEWEKIVKDSGIANKGIDLSKIISTSADDNYLELVFDKKSMNYPWIGTDFEDTTGLTKEALITQKEALFSKNSFFGNIKSDTVGKEGDDLFFPYKMVESFGTTFDYADRAFKNRIDESYMIISPLENSQKSHHSPFGKDSLGSKSLFIKSTNWPEFIKNIQSSIPKYLAQADYVLEDPLAQGFVFNESLGLGADYNSVTAQAIEQGVILPADSDGFPNTTRTPLSSKLYHEYLQKRAESIKKDKDIDAAKKGAKIRLESDEALTNAKKVGIARAIYDIGKNVVGMTSAKPTSLENVGAIVRELGQKATPLASGGNGPVPEQRLNNPAWLITDAYRAFFAELYNSKSDTGVFLKGLGIELKKSFFEYDGDETKVPDNRKIPVPGFADKTQAGYLDYKQPLIVARAIKNIINREMMMKSMRTFAGSLSDPDKQKATIKAGTSRIQGEDGKQDIIPESYNDIAKIGLDPRNVFPDKDFRTQNYLNVLEELYDKGTNTTGDVIFNPGDPKYLTASQSIDTLKNWYSTQQDDLVNTGLPVRQMMTHQEVLADGSDRSKTIDAMYSAAQEANAFLTGNTFGPLPNREQLKAMLELELGDPIQPITRAKGGLIYASAGQLINFQPQGTDTVPAMLTPGEFVVNAQSTSQHLPLLKAINNGDDLPGYGGGGLVYLSDGGEPQKTKKLTQDDRDKQLGIYTGDINRDMYISGTGGISYQPGMGSRLSIEEQKSRRREKFITNNLTLKAKTGKASQSGTIESFDPITGTVRIAKIDPKTGMPITVKNKSGESQQAYSTVSIDSLDEKSYQKVDKFYRAELAAIAAKKEKGVQQLENAVSGIRIEQPEPLIPISDPRTVAKEQKVADQVRGQAKQSFIKGSNQLFNDTVPVYNQQVIIDPVKQRPTDINGNYLDVAGMRKLVAEYDSDKFRMMLPSADEPDDVKQARLKLSEINAVSSQFEMDRTQNNAATEKRYQQLKALDDRKQLTNPNDIMEYGELALNRGVSWRDIVNPEAVQRNMRNKAYASNNTDTFGQPLATSQLGRQDTANFAEQLSLQRNNNASTAATIGGAKALGPAALGYNTGIAATALTGNPLIGLLAGAGVGTIASIAQELGLNKIVPQANADANQIMANYPVAAGVGSAIPSMGIGLAAQGVSALTGNLSQRAMSGLIESTLGTGIEYSTNMVIGRENNIDEMIRNAVINFSTGAIMPGAPRGPALNKRGLVGSLDVLDANNQIKGLRRLFTPNADGSANPDLVNVRKAAEKLGTYDNPIKNQKAREEFNKLIQDIRNNSPAAVAAAQQSKIDDIKFQDTMTGVGNFMKGKSSSLLNMGSSAISSIKDRMSGIPSLTSSVLSSMSSGMGNIQSLLANITSGFKPIMQDIGKRIKWPFGKKTTDDKKFLDMMNKPVDSPNTIQAPQKSAARTSAQQVAEQNATRIAEEAPVRIVETDLDDFELGKVDVDPGQPIISPYSSFFDTDSSWARQQNKKYEQSNRTTAFPLINAKGKKPNWIGRLMGQTEITDSSVQDKIRDSLFAQQARATNIIYKYSGSLSDIIHDTVINPGLTQLQDTQVSIDPSLAFAGRFNPRTGMAFRSFDTTQQQKGVVLEELLHSFQLTSGVLKKRYKGPIAKSIKEFLKPGGVYEQLKKKTGLPYTAEKIRNSHAELLPALARIEHTKAFQDSPMAKKMLEDLVRHMAGYANGGIVYANNGTLVPYAPRGTDTIPAMLTPGEFVINRESTQKYRPVLEAINNGNYSRGGVVNYLQNGGYLPIYRTAGGGADSMGQRFDITDYKGEIISKIGSSITEAIDRGIQNAKQSNAPGTGVSNIADGISNIDSFVNRLNNIANILSNIYIPPEITVTGKHDVVVTINGDTVLNQLQPDIQAIVMSAIRGAFQNLKANNPENNTIDFNIDFMNKMGSMV